MKDIETTHFFTIPYIKIHNPTKRKRSILFDTMNRHQMAYLKISKKVEPYVLDAEQRLIKSNYLSNKEKTKAIKGEMQKIGNIISDNVSRFDNYLVYSVRLSLTTSLYKVIETYLQLKLITKKRVSFDEITYNHATKEMYEYSLDMLSNYHLRANHEEKYKKNILKSVSYRYRPITFRCNKIGSGYALFKNEKGKLFLCLRLLSKNTTRFYTNTKIDFSQLEQVCSNNGKLKKSNCFVLFPLELSSWQYNELMNNENELDGCKLVYDHKSDDFYVNISMKKKIVVKMHGYTGYIGVKFHDEKVFVVSLYDGENGVKTYYPEDISINLSEYIKKMYDKCFVEKNKRKFSKYLREMFTHIAKCLCEFAYENNAILVMENDRQHKMFLYKKEYENLKGIIKYYFKKNGMYSPMFMNTHKLKTAYLCSNCGYYNKNRYHHGYECSNCGYKGNRVINESKNIAYSGYFVFNVKEKMSFEKWYSEILTGR